jgi:hypothetical protein
MAKRKIKKFIRAAIVPLLIPLTKISRRRNKNNVCIFHNGRCGSTVVGNLLGKHNKIHWDGQIYAKLFVKPDGKTFGKTEFEKGLAIDVLNDRMKDVFTKFYGFDVKRNHISWLNFSVSDYVQQLVHMGFDQFVVLERKNHLRTILSYTIAREAGVWHLHRNEQPVEKAIHINPDKVYLEYEEIDLLEALDEISNYYVTLRKVFAELNLSYLNLIYEEDIREDPLNAYRKIIDHIGLKPKHPKTRFNRTNPFPINKMVSNYDELAKYLSNTPYKWMLDK